MKKVLILGAGLVARPMVELLLREGFFVTLADREEGKAGQLIDGHSNGRSMVWTTDDTITLSEMVATHDIVVSLLPYVYHAGVAKECIHHRKPLVTTSYVQPAMQALNDEAVAAGIILLNETGLDPGIDHMSAMKIIDHIHDKGGKVEEFYSICGALPAPEASDNPLKYKFSWSPRGVVLASRNNAVYLKKGKHVEIEAVDLFKDRFSIDYPGIGLMEVYPNRDSVSYAGIYGINEVNTMYRGTFRYPGWCETLDLMKSIDMLSDETKNYEGFTWAGFISERANIPQEGDIRSRLAAKKGLDTNAVAIEALEWLGFFSNENMNQTLTSPFEITAGRMISRMMLRQNERDMVIMQHYFLARWKDGSAEVIRSSITDYGVPGGDTSIARTVSLPAAIAVMMILEGSIKLKGVHRPVVPEIYIPVLSRLGAFGIKMTEEYGLPVREMIGQR